MTTAEFNGLSAVEQRKALADLDIIRGEANRRLTAGDRMRVYDYYYNRSKDDARQLAQSIVAGMEPVTEPTTLFPSAAPTATPDPMAALQAIQALQTLLGGQQQAQIDPEQIRAIAEEVAARLVAEAKIPRTLEILNSAS